MASGFREGKRRAVQLNIRLHGQAVKTPPFHGGNMGSIPLGVTKEKEETRCVSSFSLVTESGAHFLYFQYVVYFAIIFSVYSFTQREKCVIIKIAFIKAEKVQALYYVGRLSNSGGAN